MFLYFSVPKHNYEEIAIVSILMNPSIIEPGGASTRTEIVGNIIYSGRAAPGASETDPVWLITKLDTTTGGAFPEIHPDGKATFTHIWGNRASLIYS